MNDFVRREWGAVSFVLVTLLGLVVVPLALSLNRHDIPVPAAIVNPSPTPVTGPAGVTPPPQVTPSPVPSPEASPSPAGSPSPSPEATPAPSPT